MASSTGTPAGRGRVLVVFVIFVLGGLLYQVIEVFTKSAVHLLLHTHFYGDKKCSCVLVTHFFSNYAARSCRL